MSAVRRRVGRAAAAILLGWVCSATGRADTPEELFDRGNSAYERGDYPAAAEAYRAVLRYRIRDPIVEFNLGNTEFRLGNLGPAILHYERARRLAPTDADILDNLRFARSFSFDRVEAPEQALPLAWLLLVQDRLGPARQAWIALALVWLAAVVVAAGLARPASFSPIHVWLLGSLLTLVVLACCSWYATHARLEGQRLAVVVDDVVEILAGPGPQNPTLFTVHEGLTLEVRAERQDWLQVGLPNGLNGWIPRQAVETV